MIRNWKLALGLATALAVFSFLLYGGGVDNPFIFDDIAKIQDNPDLHLSSLDFGNFVHDYSQKRTSLRNDPSRPLTFLSYWLLWQAGEGSPQPFHLAGMILHAVCAFLIGWILFQWILSTTGSERPMAALFAAFFFLSLPLQAGTVIYAYAFSDVLGAFFSLLLLAFISSLSELNWWQMSLAALFYAAAVFSKQSALVLPAILVAADFFTGSWVKLKARWKFHAVMFLLAALYLVWRFVFFGRIGDLEAYDTFKVSIYAPLQGIMIWKYLAWIFLPVHLTIDHALTPQMFEYWQCWLSWGAIALCSLVAFIWGRKSSRLQFISLGWFFFLFALLPTSSFFPTTDLLVDRRAYLPSAGILMALAFLASDLWEKWKGRKALQYSFLALLSLVIVINSYLTTQRVEIYGNEERLWREGIELYPRNERPRTNLATYYLRKENFQLAEKELNELLNMYPNYYEALINEAALYQHPRNPKRDLAIAYEYNRRALVQEPEDLTALMNQGILMLEINRPDQAASLFQKILELNPNLLKARLNWAESLRRMGQVEQSHEQARKVLEIDPNNLRALQLLRQ